MWRYSISHWLTPADFKHPYWCNNFFHFLRVRLSNPLNAPIASSKSLFGTNRGSPSYLPLLTRYCLISSLNLWTWWTGLSLSTVYFELNLVVCTSHLYAEFPNVVLGYKILYLSTDLCIWMIEIMVLLYNLPSWSLAFLSYNIVRNQYKNLDRRCTHICLRRYGFYVLILFYSLVCGSVLMEISRERKQKLT